MIFQKMMNIFISVLSISFLIYFLFGLYLYIFQHRFIYFPEKRVDFTPRDIGLEFEDISFQAADGIALKGWFVPRDGARGVALFFHGNAGNRGDRLDTVKKINQFGFHTFIIDYRGYGDSEGKPTEEGTYRDAEGAWQYLTEKKGFKSDEIIIWGRSLGGAIASHLTTQHLPKALILESTFISTKQIGAELYPLLPVRYLSRFHYSNKKNLKKISCPVLIIHSHEDPLIPFRHGKEIFEAAGEPKSFLEISGTHADGFVSSGRIYDEGVQSFLAKYFQ